MALLNEANKIYVGSALAAKVYLGATLVWPPTGTRQAMVIGGLFPIWVSTDGTRDTMLPGVFLSRNTSS